MTCIGQATNNLIKNSNFTNDLSNWSKSSTCSEYDTIMYNSLRILGNPSRDKNIYQTISTPGKKGDIYTLGGWVKTESVPNKLPETQKVAIHIYLNKENILRLN